MTKGLIALLAGAVLMGGCFPGAEWAGEFSTPDQIRAAARRCGVDHFEPTRAGAAWAAYVRADVPDHRAKEDCIYADLERQGLRTTR